ncbi:NUDIX hydrolase [Cyclobacterium sp.]|uniref:NUDIX hydrolase n=1 Tax=Cyclobacterium sp. TaxID=1966343 RepID=UPI0019BD8B9E|nr:NUDIX hydrolase [Cyclobacterium sp.]MBD3627184.1 NUDIX hydrolase [Cyclobacterium sp.]
MKLEIPECFYRVSVKALILDETQRFLLVKEDNGIWELPGGGLDHGESAQEGIKREIWEEMQLKTSAIADQPCFFFTVKNHKGIYIANVIYLTELEHLRFVPSPECCEVRFFSAVEVLEETSMYPNVTAFARIFMEKHPGL